MQIKRKYHVERIARRSMNDQLTVENARSVRAVSVVCAPRRERTLRSQWRRAKSHFLRRENARWFRLMNERGTVFRVRDVTGREARECIVREPLTQRGERGENRKCSVKVRRCLHSAQICIRAGLRFFAIVWVHPSPRRDCNSLRTLRALKSKSYGCENLWRSNDLIFFISVTIQLCESEKCWHLWAVPSDMRCRSELYSHKLWKLCIKILKNSWVWEKFNYLQSNAIFQEGIL